MAIRTVENQGQTLQIVKIRGFEPHKTRLKYVYV